MRALWRRIVAWLDYLVPDVDHLETPENDFEIRTRINANRRRAS